MATMNVSLPDAMKEWVEAQARSGRYANASDYVRDLIRRDQDENPPLEPWMERAAAETYDKWRADPSRGAAAEEVLDRLRQRHARRLAEKE